MKAISKWNSNEIEQKTKQVNIYSLFVREYITRISQVQKLQNSKLLAKIRENIKM